jgi:hypothetical protein
VSGVHLARVNLTRADIVAVRRVCDGERGVPLTVADRLMVTVILTRRGWSAQRIADDALGVAERSVTRYRRFLRAHGCLDPAGAPPRRLPNREVLAAAYATGASLDMLAGWLRMHPRSVSLGMRRLGIPVRRSGGRYPRRTVEGDAAMRAQLRVILGEVAR